MNFVGSGKGDYITETSFRYVGEGVGNMKVETQTTYLFGRIAAVVIAIVAIAVLLALYLGSSKTTTVQNQQAFPEPGQELGECTFWGDPHLKSFDGGRPSFYGNGEQWIVKTAEIKIQGRYMGTKYTDGLAATNKIIVGGAFIGHHHIAVGTLDSDELLIDGKAVLSSFPSRFTLPGGFGDITYDSSGELVDEATKIWQKKIVTMRLPKDVTITVFRWKNYLDLRIQMPQMDGMDGGCGNFNGDASDDTTEAVFSRIGATIGRGENLFNRRAVSELTDEEEQLLALCTPTKRQNAERACGSELGAESNPVRKKFCELDHCFGSNEHVLKMAKELGIGE